MIAEAPKSKRLSTWKIVGIVAAVVVGILLIAGFWIRSVTESRWTRLREEMKGRAERERARDPRRPVLRGTAEPGNASEEYGLAIAEMKKVPDRMKLVDLVQRTPKADPAWGVVALERNQIILDHLRAGASRSTSRQNYEWEKGSSMPLPGIGESNSIVSLAILKARFLLEAGQPREAVAVLLDAAQFGRDLADDGPMIAQFVGFKILSTVLDGLRELSASEKARSAMMRLCTGSVGS
jgi:hypothetical protein